MAAHAAGGKLIGVNFGSRAKFAADLEGTRIAYAPGCGSPMHVEGTNGGTMPCGAKLGGKQMFCGHCGQGLKQESAAQTIVNRLIGPS
jgi:hypothetical protein